MGVTDSTIELYAAIRTRLLTYTDGGAAPNTINAATSGRVYSISPPDPASNTMQTVPFVLLTITETPPSGEGDPTRFTFDVEVQVVHRPRTMTPAAFRIADLAKKALAGRIVANSATDGFVTMISPPLIAALPAGGGDADRTVVQIMVTASGYGYSKALASALT